MAKDLPKWLRWATLSPKTEPLVCGSITDGKLPPVSWYCAMLDMWATTDSEQEGWINGK